MSITTPDEPILRAEDHRAWANWQNACWLHARTATHRRAVDQAKRIAGAELAKARAPSAAWSAGKDSTVMVHLLAGLGAERLLVHSEKDDLDYPGEEDYVRRHAAAWGLELRILRPPVSPLAWIEEHAPAMSGGEDIHGRLAGLSEACFYRVVEAADRDRDLVFLGLRAEESGIRRRVRQSRGLAYDLRGFATAHPGERQRRCSPLGDWRGIDVYAYALQHEIDLLPVYKCIGWLDEHRQKPWLIRKSWWLPGAHAGQGQAAWLRRYWPSLFAVYKRLFRDAAAYT